MSVFRYFRVCSLNEEDTVTKFLRYFADYQLNLGFWMNGKDIAKNGDWRWTDGTPMSYGLPYWGTVSAHDRTNTSVQYKALIRCRKIQGKQFY